FAAAAAGIGADLARWQPANPAADPAAEYAAAAGRGLGAFGAGGVLGPEFALPETTPKLRSPASQAIGFHLVDYVVHGWDVARSLGLGRAGYRPEPDPVDSDVFITVLLIAESVPDDE